MNTQSSAVPESFAGQKVAPAVVSPTRPFYWSVRRELWEYRSIYIAPLAAAGVIIFSSLVGMLRQSAKLRAAFALNPLKIAAEQQHHARATPYDFAAGLFMVTAMIVGVFYCLDALQGERRDRSILFWKSLPVSDATTVLAKASIALVVLPLISYTLTVITQFIILLLNSAVVAGNGMSVPAYWEQVSFFQMSMMLFYHLFTVHVLGHAPFYGWMLMVSAWARRAALLWAVLPLIAIGFVEKIVFNTSYFAGFLMHQLSGGEEAVPFPGRMPIEPGVQITPGHLLLSPSLWLGLALTAAFLFAAIRLRRNREPI